MRITEHIQEPELTYYHNHISCIKQEDTNPTQNGSSSLAYVPFEEEIASVDYMSSRPFLFEPHILYSDSEYFLDSYESEDIRVSVYDTKQRKLSDLNFKLVMPDDICVDNFYIYFLSINGDALVHFCGEDGENELKIMNVVNGDIYSTIESPCYDFYNLSINSAGIFFLNTEEDTTFMFSITEEDHQNRNYSHAFKTVPGSSLSSYPDCLNFAGYIHSVNEGNDVFTYYHEDTSIDFLEIFPSLLPEMKWNSVDSIIMHSLDIANRIAIFTVIESITTYTVLLENDSVKFYVGFMWGTSLVCDAADLSVHLSSDNVFTYCNTNLKIHTFVENESNIYITMPAKKENVPFFFDKVSALTIHEDYIFGTDVFNRVHFFNTKTRVCETIDLNCAPMDLFEVEIYHNKLYLTLTSQYNSSTMSYNKGLYVPLTLDGGVQIGEVTSYDGYELGYINQEGIPFTNDMENIRIGKYELDYHEIIEEAGFLKTLPDGRLRIVSVTNSELEIHKIDLETSKRESFLPEILCDCIYYNAWGNIIVTVYMDDEEEVEEFSAILINPDDSLMRLAVTPDISDDIIDFFGPELIAGREHIYHIDFEEDDIKKIYSTPEGFSFDKNYRKQSNTVTYVKHDDDSVTYHTVSFDEEMNHRISEKTIRMQDFMEYSFKSVDVSRVFDHL
ncbi:hypothetical protein PCE1_001350 [Barthelona sp. PCE]